MNMIEKVARAMCVSQGEDPDKPIVRGTGWEGRKVVTYWQYHEGDAKAAIEAMREPTEDMMDELYSFVGGGGHPFGNTEEDCLGGYKAMIDKALEG